MKLSELSPSDYNPRKLSPANARALKKSIGRWGLVEPLIWNRRTQRLVGGHQRREQLIALGIAEALVVVVDIDETEERALNITLNNPNAQGHFDDEKLAAMLDELKAAMPDDAESLGLNALAIRELVPANKDEQPSIELIYVVTSIMDNETYRRIKPLFDQMIRENPDTLTIEVTRRGKQ